MLVLMNADSLTFALRQPPDGLAAKLEHYRDLMTDGCLAHLFILQPGDRGDELMALRGHAFELCEFIDFNDGWFEAVFVLGDDGFGHVIFVPNRPGIEPELLKVCRDYVSQQAD